MELWLSAFEWAQAIAVREGASGVSRDAPRFGLKYHLVSNGERKNVENLEKVKKCAILPSFLSETMFWKSFGLNSANSWAVAPIGDEVL